MSTADELRMLAQSAAGALQRDTEWPADLDVAGWLPGWSRLRELGLLNLFSGGGSGVDAVVVLEEVGRALFAGPVASALGADYVLTGEIESEEQFLLAGAVRGVWIDQRPSVTGRLLVADAPEGSRWVVWSRDQRQLAFVEAGGVHVDAAPRQAFDTTRRRGAADVSGLSVTLLPSPTDRVGNTVDLLQVLLACADSVGALERALDLTVDYARTRETFGVPIGKNQAVAFPLVRHSLAVRQMRLLTRRGAELLDAGLPEARAVILAAQALLGAQGVDIVSECIQLTGGIGFTWEWGLHHLVRRVTVNVGELGGAQRARSELADELGWVSA